MNARLGVVAVAVMIVLIFGGRFVKSVPPGHVGVAAFFGQVQPSPYPEGIHVPVNPFYSWVLYDVRQKTHKESAKVPTRDQLQTNIDLSVQYHLNAEMAPRILQETGDAMSVVNVHLIPTLRSLVREQGSKITRAEDFFQEETRAALESGLQSRLKDLLTPKGIQIQAVLVRDISLPQVLAQAIEQKKEREQAVERQKAELERFRTEQLQKVALAAAEREAAEEESKKRRIIADAHAYEIEKINKAAATTPAYIQLQALEALRDMAKDPAAKIYFMDSNSQTPLPLMHLGDPK